MVNKMTENKRYYRTNVNLEDNNHEPYYNIRDKKKEGNNVLFMVGGKYTSKEIVDRLNEQEERIKELEKENMEYYKLINCRKCKYHNYDSYANGDDFEICEKGNNERLIYHYFCNEFEK